MGLLSNESVSLPTSGVAAGIEFEETFPDPAPAEAEANVAVSASPVTTPTPHDPAPPAREAAPRLTVVRSEPEPDPGVSEAVYQDQLERRLREAETLVKQTIERMRLEEEQRLAEWVQQRRAEEEQRLAKWLEERRSAVERTMEQRKTSEDKLAGRIEDLLVEWQGRFEQRLEQRRIDDERVAERRRMSDEERLRAWRAELEQALTDRFSQRRFTDRAPLPDRNGELRSPVRDAIAMATSARDLGRILRDTLAELARTSAFALSVHHTQRDEVAYRYRVASDDDLGSLLRREPLDDGPTSAVSHMDGWVRAHRAVRVGMRNATVHTAQCAVRTDDRTIGVVTLHSEGVAIADAVLSRVTDLIDAAAPRLAELRAAGSYRGV